jgi:hypothetical protein
MDESDADDLAGPSQVSTVTVEQMDLDYFNSLTIMNALLRIVDHLYTVMKIPQQDPNTGEPVLPPGDKLPEHIEYMSRRLADPSAPLSMRLLLVKLILNRPLLFRPWASFWVPEIMKAMLDLSRMAPNQETRSVLSSPNSFHYLLRDVCRLIAHSWSEETLKIVWKPALPSEQALCTDFLTHIIRCAPARVSALFQTHLGFIEKLMQRWCASGHVRPDARLLQDYICAKDEGAGRTTSHISTKGLQIATACFAYRQLVKVGFAPVLSFEFRVDGEKQMRNFFTFLLVRLQTYPELVRQHLADLFGAILGRNPVTASPPLVALQNSLVAPVLETLVELHKAVQTQYGTAERGHGKFLSACFRISKYAPDVLDNDMVRRTLQALSQSTGRLITRGSNLFYVVSILHNALQGGTISVGDLSISVAPYWSMLLRASVPGRRKGASVQLETLRFLRALVPSLTEKQLLPFFTQKNIALPQIFSHHRSSACRYQYYAVLMEMWMRADGFAASANLAAAHGARGHSRSTFSSTPLQSLVRRYLLCGLSDPNPEIRRRLYEWWNEGDRLSPDFFTRLLQTYRDWYDPSLEGATAWLLNCSPLVLSLLQRHPQFSSAPLFENPIGGSGVPVSHAVAVVRAANGTLKPLFASSIKQGNAFVGTGGLRRSLLGPRSSAAGQPRLIFSLTQDAGKGNKQDGAARTAVSSFAMMASSTQAQLSASAPAAGGAPIVGSGLATMSTQDFAPGARATTIQANNGAVAVKATTLSAFLKRRTFYGSGRGDTDSAWKEKRAKSTDKVYPVLLRNYKTGDVPDIQITLADLLLPLTIICQLDAESARTSAAALFDYSYRSTISAATASAVAVAGASSAAHAGAPSAATLVLRRNLREVAAHIVERALPFAQQEQTARSSLSQVIQLGFDLMESIDRVDIEHQVSGSLADCTGVLHDIELARAGSAALCYAGAIRLMENRLSNRWPLAMSEIDTSLRHLIPLTTGTAKSLLGRQPAPRSRAAGEIRSSLSALRSLYSALGEDDIVNGISTSTSGFPSLGNAIDAESRGDFHSAAGWYASAIDQYMDMSATFQKQQQTPEPVQRRASAISRARSSIGRRERRFSDIDADLLAMEDEERRGSAGNGRDAPGPVAVESGAANAAYGVGSSGGSDELSHIDEVLGWDASRVRCLALMQKWDQVEALVCSVASTGEPLRANEVATTNSSLFDINLQSLRSLDTGRKVVALRALLHRAGAEFLGDDTSNRPDTRRATQLALDVATSRQRAETVIVRPETINADTAISGTHAAAHIPGVIGLIQILQGRFSEAQSTITQGLSSLPDLYASLPALAAPARTRVLMAFQQLVEINEYLSIVAEVQVATASGLTSFDAQRRLSAARQRLPYFLSWWRDRRPVGFAVSNTEMLEHIDALVASRSILLGSLQSKLSESSILHPSAYSVLRTSYVIPTERALFSTACDTFASAGDADGAKWYWGKIASIRKSSRRPFSASQMGLVLTMATAAIRKGLHASATRGLTPLTFPVFIYTKTVATLQGAINALACNTGETLDNIEVALLPVISGALRMGILSKDVKQAAIGLYDYDLQTLAAEACSLVARQALTQPLDSFPYGMQAEVFQSLSKGLEYHRACTAQTLVNVPLSDASYRHDPAFVDYEGIDALTKNTAALSLVSLGRSEKARQAASLLRYAQFADDIIHRLEESALTSDIASDDMARALLTEGLQKETLACDIVRSILLASSYDSSSVLSPSVQNHVSHSTRRAVISTGFLDDCGLSRESDTESGGSNKKTRASWFFPRIIELCGSYSSPNAIVHEMAKSSSAGQPFAYHGFLPWIPQLFASMHPVVNTSGENANALVLPKCAPTMSYILRELARRYPQAVFYPMQIFAEEDMREELLTKLSQREGAVYEQIIDTLTRSIHNPLLAEFVAALEDLYDPASRFGTLTFVQYLLDSVRANSLYHSLFYCVFVFFTGLQRIGFLGCTLLSARTEFPRWMQQPSFPLRRAKRCLLACGRNAFGAPSIGPTAVQLWVPCRNGG